MSSTIRLATTLALLMVLCIVHASAARAGETEPLMLDAKIQLGAVKGRIDHFAYDSGRQRLFVAELGNDSVGVIDAKEGKLLYRIAGLAEPQGVGYVPWTDTLLIANARDGSVRFYKGDDFSPAGSIDLGSDADNIRVDTAQRRVFVGYGMGALAAIDMAGQAKAADIKLKAHPEAFQFDWSGTRIFVNLPGAGEIALVDVAASRQDSAWPTGNAGANFPMAVDRDGQRVIVVFRNPAKMRSLAADGGAAIERDTCGDSDDVFFDAKRHYIYVSCGEGFVDVFDARATGYERIGHLATVAGARTSLFVPELDRLFVGVRAAGKEPAAIWAFRPSP